MSYDVDLFVIGAGSGGVRAARIAAGHGAQGDGRRGVPHRRHLRDPRLRAQEAAGLREPLRRPFPRRRGLRLERSARRASTGGSWSRPRRRRSPAFPASTARISTARRSRSSRPRATVTGPHAVRLADGREISARHILVATGAHPQPLPGLEGGELAITSNEIFDLAEFPRRLLVVGGGYIAVEFASLFQRLGAKVDRGHARRQCVARVRRGHARRPARRDDRAPASICVSACCRAASRSGADGLDVTFSDGDERTVSTRCWSRPAARPTREASASRRRASSSTPRARSRSTPVRRRNVPSIHAVGDVTNRINLTPVAIREGHLLADRLFGGGAATVDHDERRDRGVHDARDRHGRPDRAAGARRFGTVDIYRANFRPMKATLTGSGERTIMKLIVEPRATASSARTFWAARPAKSSRRSRSRSRWARPSATSTRRWRCTRPPPRNW